MATTAQKVLSRFEEGKPADPTENMSPEDAAEWRRMNEEHGDKFKTAMEAGRKPKDTAERHQLKILLDTVKNPQKGFLGGPDAQEAEATLREKFQYTEAEIRKLKQASQAERVADRYNQLVASQEDDGEWNPDQKRGEWNLTLMKDKNRWRYFLQNPVGGGGGSGNYSSKGAAYAAATGRVNWDKPEPKTLDKIWVIEREWDPHAGDWKTKKKSWQDLPKDWRAKLPGPPSRAELDRTRGL